MLHSVTTFQPQTLVTLGNIPLFRGNGVIRNNLAVSGARIILQLAIHKFKEYLQYYSCNHGLFDDIY